MIGIDDAHAPFALGVERLQQRDVDDLQFLRPGAQHQGQVGLGNALVAQAQLVLQMEQACTLARHQQHARGFLVQAVHQFEKLLARPRAAQLFDHAVAHAAATVHRHARRFVDRDQVRILKDHRELARRHREWIARGRDAHRRHANLVADGQARVGGGATLVDAHLAAADHAMHVALRNALQPLDQKVVEPLPGRTFIDLDIVHARARRFGLGRWGGAPWRRALGPYNALHHVVALSV